MIIQSESLLTEKCSTFSFWHNAATPNPMPHQASAENIVVVGKQGDAQEAVLPTPLQHVIQQLAADAMATVGLGDDDIFEQGHETTFGGADGDEEVGHGDDLTLLAGDKNLPAPGVVEDEAQAARLLFLIRLEVMFLGKELAQQLLQRGEVVETGGADLDG